MSGSAIEWTDETWNVVTGCTRISPGCKNCYMYKLYPRLKSMGVPGYETFPVDVALHPGRLQQPQRWRKPRMVFVNSMSDTFNERVPDYFLRWLFQAMLHGGGAGPYVPAADQAAGAGPRVVGGLRGRGPGRPVAQPDLAGGVGRIAGVRATAAGAAGSASPRRSGSYRPSLSWARSICGSGWAMCCSG